MRCKIARSEGVRKEKAEGTKSREEKGGNDIKYSKTYKKGTVKEKERKTKVERYQKTFRKDLGSKR